MTNKEKWMENYNLCKKYYEEHENLLFPFNYTVEGKNLYRWVGRQRKKIKNKELSDEQISLLNEFNIMENQKNTVDNYKLRKDRFLNTDWLSKYEIAKQYFEEHGNLLLKHNESFKGFNLGRWLFLQRNNKDHGFISSEHINMLDEIGMIWDVFEYKWFINYNKAKQYYEEHKNIIVPSNHPLSMWLHNRRSAYRANKLSQNRMNLLNEIL